MITLYYMQACFILTNTNNGYALLLNLESSEKSYHVSERAGSNYRERAIHDHVI
jgi:hypothetical protein